MKEVNNLRSFLYKFFALMFMYPSKRNLEILKNEFLSDNKLKENFKYLINSDSSHVFSGVDFITSTLTSITEEEWEKVYVATFGHTVGDIPLYETKYFPENVFAESQRLADINAFYTAFGVKVSEQTKEKLDHISIELEFMSYILEKELYAIKENNEEYVSVCRDAAKKFFNEHLGQWALKFCNRLLQFSKNEFYKKSGVLFQAFLNHEHSIFES